MSRGARWRALTPAQRCAELSARLRSGKLTSRGRAYREREDARRARQIAKMAAWAAERDGGAS